MRNGLYKFLTSSFSFLVPPELDDSYRQSLGWPYHLNQQSLDYEEVPNLNAQPVSIPRLDVRFSVSSQSRDCWISGDAKLWQQKGGAKWQVRASLPRTIILCYGRLPDLCNHWVRTVSVSHQAWLVRTRRTAFSLAVP